MDFSVSIAPKSTKLVKVRAKFIENSKHLLVEKKLATNSGPEDIYGCTDTLISKEAPFVFISNFSKKSVTVPAGQILSQGHNHLTWLNKGNQFTLDQWEGICAHANVLQSVINLEGISTDKNLFVQTAQSEVKTIYNMLRRHYSSEEVLAKPPLEGGPKTAETPEDSVPASQLLKEIDISPSLTQVQT